jgi:hypothetical protein
MVFAGTAPPEFRKKRLHLGTRLNRRRDLSPRFLPEASMGVQASGEHRCFRVPPHLTKPLANADIHRRHMLACGHCATNQRQPV